MRLAKHILAVLTVVLLFTSCGGKNDKVIPRGKLAEIYAEMLILDQWISTRQGARRTADTTLVYEPILEKYGYTSADYRRSVDEYMNDPERYSRILRTTVGIMDDKLAELAERKAEIDVFLDEYKTSIEYIGNPENIDSAANYVVENGIIAAVPAAKKALTNLGGAISYLEGSDMKLALVAFYSAIGIKTPADEFYYAR